MTQPFLVKTRLLLVTCLEGKGNQLCVLNISCMEILILKGESRTQIKAATNPLRQPLSSLNNYDYRTLIYHRCTDVRNRTCSPPLGPDPPTGLSACLYRICVMKYKKSTELKNCRLFVNNYDYRTLHIYYLERKTGLEPATPTLARLCSTN